MGMYLATRELSRVTAILPLGPSDSSQPIDKFCFSVALWEFWAVTEASGIKDTTMVQEETKTHFRSHTQASSFFLGPKAAPAPGTHCFHEGRRLAAAEHGEVGLSLPISLWKQRLPREGCPHIGSSHCCSLARFILGWAATHKWGV